MLKRNYVLPLVATATFWLCNPGLDVVNRYVATSLSQAEEPQEEELPLVLSADENEEESNEEVTPTNPSDNQEGDLETIPASSSVDDETIPDPAFADETVTIDDDIIELPPVDGNFGLPTGDELTREEMEEISTRPLFREFANALDEVAPMPREIDVEGLGVPGAELIMPEPRSTVSEAVPNTSNGDVTRALDEVLSIADVDLESLNLSPNHRATIAQLDAEIQRLCPLWIDAELNRDVIGRREINWKQQGAALFTTDNPKPIDEVASDWAMAPDERFFFQVTDSLTKEIFYTKAGDFEQIDQLNFLSPALVRDDRSYELSLEPGRVVPTGRAERIRVQKNGQVQGIDVSGRLVTDVNVANVPLFMFDNPARLQSDDGVFFTPTPFSGEPRQVKLPLGSKIGVTPGKVLPSNGKPEEIFARIVVLCKTKKRLVEILSQPRLQ